MSSSRRNPSIDPMARAIPANELKITEILDCDTGEFIDAREFIESHTYGEIFAPRQEMRKRWNTDTPKCVCSYCKVPISLLGGLTRNWFYFRHCEEDGRCPARTRGKLNQKQINALRYESVVESEPHKRFKQLMYDCLSADSSFSDVEIEKVRVSKTKNGTRRKPDASAVRDQILHAFEVQLSSTFLDVVLDRQAFYAGEGAIRIWVLPEYDPSDRNMMEDDILFHNNCNVMVLDEAIAERSISEGKLHFGCWYRVPLAKEQQYSEEWEYAVVSFDALTIDLERQRVFHFDYEAEKEAARTLIAERIEAEEKLRVERELRNRKKELREQFEEFWLEHARAKRGTSDAWGALRNKNGWAMCEIALPEGPFDDSELSALLNALYWAKHLRQVGWEHQDIVKVGHHVFDKHQRHFALFCHCLWHFKQISEVKKVDATGKLQSKIQMVRNTPIAERGMFRLEPRHSALAELLFPEPFARFQDWLNG